MSVLPSSSDLRASLVASGVREVDDSALARSLYASDASLYRVPPRLVVRPREVDEIGAILSVAREYAVPVTMRGAGTSIAGNAVGPGIVVDTSRWLSKVSIDAEARTATVLPGTVHATVQRAAAAHGLRFGPDPSTHSRCTVGGMIGNNACGSRALGYGRTSDNVVSLEALLVDGTDVHSRRGDLDRLVEPHRDLVRREFGRFPRQISGYAMDQLLTGGGLDRFLVGSEGTLAVITGATVRLIEEPAARALAVLGYPDMAEAADGVPELLGAAPVACEGLDRRMTDVVARRGALPELPAGAGWLFVEVTGDSIAEAQARAERVATLAGRPHRIVVDEAEQAALWRIREAGAGLAAISMERPGHSGWEDAAVPPAGLGAYVREFEALVAAHGLHTVPYGHFGDGCVHARIDFDMSARGRYRAFVEEAAGLVAAHGGSMSGEHGDGRARSELLPTMYSTEAISLMSAVKNLFDPTGILNPGVVVDPRPLDADLRQARPVRRDLADLAAGVHRCTGVGACLAGPGSGVMCPSYAATREEKDSTRGRARVLQDVVAGHLGLDAPEVAEVMDLCLACKGCASDCPTGVDMADYKSQVRSRSEGRRPRSQIVLGNLPRLLRRTPPVAARWALTTPGVAGLVAKAAGLDARRRLPVPSRRRLRQSESAASPDVWLWADTFTDHLAAEVGRAAINLLESAGHRVGIVPESACCGLTYFSTGQRDVAAASMRRAADVLGKYDNVIGLEPSCVAALRHDAPAIIGEEAAAVGHVRTLAEFLDSVGWEPPDIRGFRLVAQPHCHHASVIGWDADRRLLERAGVDLVVVPGCCGLAGDFGMTPDHFDVSRAVFDHDLGSALDKYPEAVVLADGFSCRTQVRDFAADRRVVTLAELFAGSIT